MNDDWGNQDITEDIHEWSVDSMEEKIKRLKRKSTYKSQ